MGLNSFQTSGNSPGHARAVTSASSASAPSAPPSPAGSPAPIPSRTSTSPTSATAAPATSAPGSPSRSPACTWTDRFDDLLASDVDIIVEAVSGAEPAVDYVRAALLAGKSVVTANKQVIAHHGPALLTLAERQGRQLRFEAAVGGAMPIVRALGDGLAGDRVLRDRRDPERHHQRGAVADGRRSAARWTKRSPTPARAATRKPIRRSISTASTPPPSSRSSARSAFGVRVLPGADRHADHGADRRSTICGDARLRGGTIRQIAHAEYDRERSVARRPGWRRSSCRGASLFAPDDGPAERRGRHRARTPATSRLTGHGRGRRRHRRRRSSATCVAIARDRAAIVPAPVLVEPQEIKGLSDQKFAEAV